MSDFSQREVISRVRSAAELVLRDNWRQGHRASDGVPYAFTCPATPRYRHQWYWDSCFHAIAWRHIDPERAREELRTLLRAGRLDGFIPHTAFWDRPAYWRRAPFYGTHTVFGCSATATIQTPLLALAWELVADASPDDPGFATEALPQLRLHYDWLAQHRDPDGDGLLTIIQPDESGLDDSPKYDDCFRWMRHDHPGHFWLVERYRRLSYDAATIAARYEEHVEDVLVNVFYALALRALVRLCALDPGATDQSVYLERARDTERALLRALPRPRHRPVLRPRGLGRTAASGVNLVIAGAVGSGRASRGRAPPAGRGASARRSSLSGAVRDPIRVDGGGVVPTGLPDLALLARPVVDEHQLATGARDARPWLHGGRRPDHRLDAARSRPARTAGVLQPTHRGRACRSRLRLLGADRRSSR